jgi:predicted ATPase
MITKLNIYGTVKSITQEALNYLFNQTKGNPLHTKSLTLLLLDGGTFVIVEKT